MSFGYCEATSLRVLDISSLASVCYPRCVQRAVISASSTQSTTLLASRCQDDEDVALCNLAALEGFTSLVGEERSGSSLAMDYHLYDNGTIQQTFLNSFAVAYDLKFDAWNDLDGLLSACSSSSPGNCTYVSIYYETAGSNIRVDIGGDLIVSVQLAQCDDLGVDLLPQCWGFRLFVTPIFSFIGWSCSSLLFPSTADLHPAYNEDMTSKLLAIDSCSWYGVTCDNLTSQITALDLRSRGLRGSLSSSIGSLTMLTSLDLSYNSLSNTLPSSLQYLTNLATLSLSNNFFNGSLSSSLTTLLESAPLLKFIDVSAN